MMEFTYHQFLNNIIRNNFPFEIAQTAIDRPDEMLNDGSDLAHCIHHVTLALDMFFPPDPVELCRLKGGPLNFGHVFGVVGVVEQLSIVLLVWMIHDGFLVKWKWLSKWYRDCVAVCGCFLSAWAVWMPLIVAVDRGVSLFVLDKCDTSYGYAVI